MNKKRLIDKFIALNKQCQGISDCADLEGRELSAAERVKIDGLLAEADEIEVQIDRMGGIPGPGRQTAPQQPGNFTNSGNGSMGREAGPQAPRGYSNFKAPGEFFQAVKNSCARGGTMDPRLIMDAPTTISTRRCGGGWWLSCAPSWSRDIFSTVMGEGSLVDRCNVVPVTGNQYVQVLDTGAPWADSRRRTGVLEGGRGTTD